MIIEKNAIILSITPGIVLLSWKTRQTVSQHTFEIFRNKEKIGETKSQPNIVVYTFKDYTADVRDLFRIYEYEIRVNGESYGLFSWDTMYRVYELDILVRHDYFFHYNNGSPMVLYSERTDASSPRCPFCWDITSQRAIGSCPVCMGTGRQVPYYDPVVIWVEFGGNSKILDVSLVEAQPGQKRMTANGLPRLKPGDIVLEPFKHELWKIEQVQCIGRDTAPVVQQCACKRIETNSDLYKYMIFGESEVQDIVNEMNEINKEKRF